MIVSISDHVPQGLPDNLIHYFFGRLPRHIYGPPAMRPASFPLLFPLYHKSWTVSNSGSGTEIRTAGSGKEEQGPGDCFKEARILSVSAPVFVVGSYRTEAPGDLIRRVYLIMRPQKTKKRTHAKGYFTEYTSGVRNSRMALCMNSCPRCMQSDRLIRQWQIEPQKRGSCPL